jgi:hypothetical protein
MNLTIMRVKSGLSAVEERVNKVKRSLVSISNNVGLVVFSWVEFVPLRQEPPEGERVKPSR